MTSRQVTWLAAGLAAGASLIRWLATDTQAHAWSTDAVIALASAAAHMTLAVVLAAGAAGVATSTTDGRVTASSGTRTWRPLHLAGAVVGGAIALASLAALLATDAPTAGHAGHGAGSAAGIDALDAVRIGVELALVGVLVWLYRRTGDEPVAAD